MSQRITFAELAALLAERQHAPRTQAEGVLRAILTTITETLSTDPSVKIKGLGQFRLVQVERRESVDVNTGSRVEIEPHTKLSFVPDTALGAAINKPFAYFSSVELYEGVQFDELPQTTEPMEATPAPIPAIAEPIETHMEAPKVEAPEPVPVAANSSAPAAMPAATIETYAETPKTEVPEPVLVASDSSTSAAMSTAPIEIHMEAPKEEAVAAAAPKGQPQAPQKGRGKWLIGVCAATLLMLLFCGVYHFGRWNALKELSATQPVVQVIPPKAEEPIIAEKTDFVPLDTLSAQPVDTLVAQPITESHAMSESFPERNAVDLNATPTVDTPSGNDVRVVGVKCEHRVADGETLRLIALHYYGSKDLSTVIVTHNAAIIPNPDRVPVGLVIEIPELAP